ncbi:hypothetical protein ACP3S7_04275 [Phytobacter ursingii]
MPIFNALFEPKKGAIKDGAVQLAISIEAPNKKVAGSILLGKLWESYPASGDHYFAPKIWEDAPGQPRPEIGKFDEQFPKENTFDGTMWVQNAAPAAAEPDFPSPDEIVDLMTLSARERIAAVVLFSDGVFTGALLSQVRDYLDDLENRDANLDDYDDRFNRYLMNALCGHLPVSHMHVEGLNNLIQAILTKFENSQPGRAALAQFVKSWTDNPGKRDELMGDTTSSTSSTSSTSNDAQLPSDKPTPSQIGPRGYPHTYASLDQEIALALLPIEVTEKVSVTALRRAEEEIIEQDREDFKRWSISLRTTPNILQYDRASIFGVVQNVPAKDTYHFPESLRRYIDTWLEKNGRFETQPEQPKVTHLGGSKFSVEGLIQDSPSNQGEKKEVAPPAAKGQQEVVTETQAEQARATLNQMGYGVYATPSSKQQPKTEAKSPVPTAENAEGLMTAYDLLAEQAASEETVRSRVADVEKSLDNGDNLTLWKRVFKTDERFTKAFTQNGGGTSINGTYMTMLATREFGPKGIGWGVEIQEERFDNGAPITRKVKGSDGNETWEIIPNGSGGYLTEIHHVIKIKLWYLTADGGRGEEIAYGCTPYLYSSKYGPISDGEAPKKSLTDATKKALSSLGFAADIFMGLYDNPEYRQQNKSEFAIKNASENAENAALLRQELDEKLTRVANTLATGVSENEITKVYASVAREVEVHRKAAADKGDEQHARYLSGRLRRLTAIKDGRLKELSKDQEKSA